VLLPTNGLDDAGVTALADTLIAMLGMPISQDQGFLRIRANIGIALMPKHAEGAEALEKYASIATHKAKGQGAGVSCMFRPDWAHQAEYRYQLMAALREAIEADELHLHFQPIVDVQRQEVRVFEALARWTHPTLGQIPPNQFITLAEESGEMPALGQWILRRACQQARQLIGVYCGRIAVNISMHQLLHEAFFVHLDDALRISGLQPNELELELTESVFSRDIESVLAAVRALRNRGISIAIDDFGTGYSSLAYLQRFPTDIIKVDRSFANTLGSGGETIIAAAQSIGRSFGMQVVIEGVETEAILLQLRALGLDLFQGYYIAKPMPVGDIDAWFRASPYTAASSGTVITKRPGLTSASGIRSRP